MRQQSNCGGHVTCFLNDFWMCDQRITNNRMLSKIRQEISINKITINRFQKPEFTILSCQNQTQHLTLLTLISLFTGFCLHLSDSTWRLCYETKKLEIRGTWSSLLADQWSQIKVLGTSDASQKKNVLRQLRFYKTVIELFGLNLPTILLGGFRGNLDIFWQA